MATLRLRSAPGHLIRRAQQVHTLFWAEEVSSELTSVQFAVLNALRASPGIDQRTLGRQVRLDRSTVGDVVVRLMRRGFVERTRDAHDGRRNLLRLTRAGGSVHAEVLPGVRRVQRRLLAPLSPEERTTFLRLVRKIVDASESFDDLSPYDGDRPASRSPSASPSTPPSAPPSPEAYPSSPPTPPSA